MIWELRHKYKITAMLKVAGLARSSYYYYTREDTQPDKYAAAKETIAAIYHENRGRYGYRRITLEVRNRGIHLNHKTVQRLMKELGLACRVRMKKYRSYKGQTGEIAPNLLERNFEAARPDEKWVTDVTEFACLGVSFIFPLSLICTAGI